MDEALAADLKQGPQSVFQQTPGVMAKIEMAAHQRTQGTVGRQAAFPWLRGREAETAARIGAAFQFEDEQQPVHDDQCLPPQQRGVRRCRGVSRLAEDGAQKRLDRRAGLRPQDFRDMRLMQPRGLENPLHRRHAARRRQCRDETIRVRHPVMRSPS